MATNIVYGSILGIKLLLPFFDHIAERAEWDYDPPFTAQRISKISSFTNNPSVAISLDSGRFRFFWRANETNHYQGRLSQFTDWKESLFALDPVSDLAPLTKVPSKISEREALAIAKRFLARLGYDETKNGYFTPEVHQCEFLNVDTGSIQKLPFFAVRCLPRFVPNGIDDNLRTGIKLEVSGTTKRVVHFVQIFIRNEQVDLRDFAKPEKPLSPALSSEEKLKPKAIPRR